MTDAQLAALISAIVAFGAAIGGALRWAVLRLAASWDKGSDALIANTASNAVLASKLEAFGKRLDEVVDNIDALGAFVDEHSGVKPVPRRRTPPGGSPVAGGEYGLTRKGGGASVPTVSFAAAVAALELEREAEPERLVLQPGDLNDITLPLLRVVQRELAALDEHVRLGLGPKVTETNLRVRELELRQEQGRLELHTRLDELKSLLEAALAR